MPAQMKVVFRNVPRSIALEDLIQEKIEVLEKINNRIIVCQATIEKTQKTKESSGLYRVRLDITFPPRHDIVVKKESKTSGRYDNLARLVSSAFKIALRQLEHIKETQYIRAKLRPRKNKYENLTFHSFPTK